MEAIRSLALPRGAVNVAFSQDNRRVLTCCADSARIWDVETGESLLELKQNEIAAAQFSPDDSRIATVGGAGRRSAKIWDAGTGQEILTLTGHPDKVSSVAFSPDGQRLVTGSHDHTAKIWDAATGAALLTLGQPAHG